MNTVISRDGTPIACHSTGTGPALVLVVGAFNDHSTGTQLAGRLAAAFTVHTYDRRGRGDSGDLAPYTVECELDDLDAVIDAAGGAAAVFGYSSGALLALHAAARGSAITRLALYEAPYDSAPRLGPAQRVGELVRAGRRGEAVEYFQAEIVGMPAELVTRSRSAPFRPALEAMAHTLEYDLTITGTPVDTQAVTIPVLALAGGASPTAMRERTHALAAALPDATARELPGASHHLDPAALAPILTEFCAR
ncbi:alpha/beta fold hydrolase [Nonomuraea ceibae]|uniref:alpha/beta fold hydrolase n=1 Tax=Nonomuraea ceibae TaxID=1935170 RepID=UPI001C606E3B|nr:alpha/beta hydrolase [Nonomuraea ceibae]